MKKTIWKFELDVTDCQKVMMPDGAEILTAQMQGNSLCLWAVVDPREQVKVGRIIEMFGTGNPVDCDMGTERRYISTVQMAGGQLIWHLFESVGL